jgi:phage shock protein PspC (stress-responsive transcriptional regulator)
MTMQKVISAHLDARVFVFEAEGYERLRAWLDEAGTRLRANPDREEILADLEQSLADKCAALLLAGRQFVAFAEIERMLAELGPVDAGESSTAADSAAASSAASASRGAQAGAQADARPRRLYQIREGAVLTGLCKGLGAHFNIDVTWVRVGFVALGFFSGGAAVLMYLLLALIVPYEDAPSPPAAIDVLQANVRALFEQLRRLFRGSHDGPASGPASGKTR